MFRLKAAACSAWSEAAKRRKPLSRGLTLLLWWLSPLAALRKEQKELILKTETAHMLKSTLFERSLQKLCSVLDRLLLSLVLVNT